MDSFFGYNADNSSAETNMPYYSEETYAKCGVDYNDMYSGYKVINDDLSATNNDSDKMFELVMSDQFLAQVNNFAQKVKTININSIKCLNNNDRDKVCSSSDKADSMATLVQLERLLMVINKYNTTLNEISSWIFMNIHDLYQYCGKDTAKLQRIRQIISRLSYIMADQIEMNKMMTGNTSITPPISEESLINRITSPITDTGSEVQIIPEYIGEYAGAYAGTYAGTYAGEYAGAYAGAYAGESEEGEEISVQHQLVCPAGYHKDITRGGEYCVPDTTTTTTTTTSSDYQTCIANSNEISQWKNITYFLLLIIICFLFYYILTQINKKA